MRWRARAAACAAALAFVAVPRLAEAAPVLHVEWPSVPGCPGSSVVLEHARAAIVRGKQVDDVRAIAEVTPPSEEGGSWHLYIRTRTLRGTGERTLEAPSCEAVARAAGLFMALAALRSQTSPSEHAIEELAPEPDRVEEPGAAAAQPVALEAAAPHTEKVNSARFSTGAGLWIAIGILPTVAVGPSASFGFEAGEWSARIGVMASLPQDRVREGLGAELSTLGASLDVCRRLPLPLLLHARTRACAGASVDEVHASGVGVETFDVRRTTAMAFAGLGAAWDIGRSFRISADARVGASLLRPRFVVDSTSEGKLVLHRPAAVRAEGTLTFGVVF